MTTRRVQNNDPKEVMIVPNDIFQTLNTINAWKAEDLKESQLIQRTNQLSTIERIRKRLK